jgi:hypothetical protein
VPSCCYQRLLVLQVMGRIDKNYSLLSPYNLEFNSMLHL